MDNIWMYDWQRDSAERLTSDPAADTNPTWTPDGTRIAFASTRGNAPAPNIYWQRVDATANAQRLTESPNEQHPGSWHPSGRFLAFEEVHPTTGADLMILPMEGDEASGWRPGKPTVFANGPSDERTPVFSPDGRWIAYVSNDSGRNEVFVRAFQGTGRWPVSVAGGLTPTWSRTKQELYYETANVGEGGRLVVVPYSTDGGVFQPHKPELLTPERHETRRPPPEPRHASLQLFRRAAAPRPTLAITT
jgi:Tol biopolymer transport system component